MTITAKKSVEHSLRFLRYYLLGVIDTCARANSNQIQFDLIELYSRAALKLVYDISPDMRADEDQIDMTKEV